MGKQEQEINIGILFNGKMKVCSVSKFTTCDDVIEMLMYSSTSVDHAYEYALFETAHGVEKMLTGKSSVLKVVRSWGAAKGQFTGEKSRRRHQEKNQNIQGEEKARENQINADGTQK